MSEVYSDINLWAGVLSPYIVVVDGSAVNQNILILCDTPVGSKWFRPRIGTAILSYLFDPFDSKTASAIQIELKNMLLSNGENRALIHYVDVVPDWNRAMYYVEIIYSIAGLQAEKASFAFYLSKEKVS